MVYITTLNNPKIILVASSTCSELICVWDVFFKNIKHGTLQSAYSLQSPSSPWLSRAEGSRNLMILRS